MTREFYLMIYQLFLLVLYFRMNKIFDYMLFKHPFSCIVAGPSKSGKTQLIHDIIQSHKKYISPTIDRIIYCYSEWQQSYLHMTNIEFKQGLIEYDSLTDSENKLVIIDDLMEEGVQNRLVVDLFTKGSHHKNLSVIFICQNLFNKGKHSRTISLNSQYLILFKNPRDQSQIRHLACQMFPTNPKFLIQSYNDATLNPHGYLFIDNNQSTENDLRIQSNVTLDVPIVYIQK